MASKLPPFRTVTQDELRRIWREHPDSDSRRLVLEVERYRRVIAEIDTLYKAAHRAWLEQVGGELTALHMLKKVMNEERFRLPLK